MSCKEQKKRKKIPTHLHIDISFIQTLTHSLGKIHSKFIVDLILNSVKERKHSIDLHNSILIFPLRTTMLPRTQIIYYNNNIQCPNTMQM